jgi:transporter family-2 protein
MLNRGCMSRAIAFVLTVGAGGLVALQPPANAALSKHVGDLGAAFVSLVISITVIGLLLLIADHPGKLSGLSSFRPEYAVGGLAGASIVLISLITVRHLGVGGVIAVLVAAQLVVSVIADRFRLYGVPHVGISAGRIVGLALVISGTLLITRA